MRTRFSLLIRALILLVVFSVGIFAGYSLKDVRDRAVAMEYKLILSQLFTIQKVHYGEYGEFYTSPSELENDFIFSATVKG